MGSKASLKDSVFSPETYEQEDISFLKLAGLYYFNKYYTFYHITGYFIGGMMMAGMTIGCFLHGEISFAFEVAHLELISINMLVQVVVYRLHSDKLMGLFRAIDQKFFSYGDTIDDETQKIINQLEEEKKKRKQSYTKIFKLQVACSAVAQMFKRPVLNFINGHGMKEVDGLDWLMYESPSGAYFPYSDTWTGYIIGQILSYNIIVNTGLIAAAATTCYLRISEELLHQLDIVKLGFRNSLRRAQHLYQLRYGRTLEECEPNEDFNKCLLACFKKSVEHHIVVIKLFDSFNKFMSIPFFTVIFDGSALICMSTALFLRSEGPTVKLIMTFFVFTESYYTFIYCIYGERLTNKFRVVNFEGQSVFTENFKTPYLNS